jgi:hypothetical protein
MIDHSLNNIEATTDIPDDDCEIEVEDLEVELL